MNAEQLLQGLETRTHSERVQAVIALGRRNDNESRSVLAELERGGFYERSLALYACFGSRDAGHAMRALSDPSRLLRGLAARLAGCICSDADIALALENSPRPARLALLWKLHKQHRQAAIDAFLDRAGASSEPDFYSLLPLGSRALVARTMTYFTEHATAEDWRRLARLHPAEALAALEQQAVAMTTLDGKLLARANAALPLLARSEPDGAVTLVTSLRRTVSLEHIRAESLADRRPAQYADLVLGQRGQLRHVPVSLRRHVDRLSAEQIIALYRRKGDAFGWDASWFARLAPEQRLMVFRALARSLRRGDLLRTTVVAALPSRERWAEARRYIAVTRYPLVTRLTYAAYLPWDEATAVLTPHLHAADTGVRQAALAAHIGAVAYHRDRLGEVLIELRERRSEQDGTRHTMLIALRSLPASAWRRDHLADLEEIIRHGLNDVGLSPQTLQEIVGLLVKLLPAFPDWAGQELVVVLRERGWTPPTRTATSLTPAAERELGRSLAPLLDAWAARDNEAAVLGSADRLLTHPTAFAFALPALQDLLSRSRTPHIAGRALTLLADRAPDRFAQLVPTLVAEDSSWITFAPVSMYLLRHRQDLLDPFLGFQPYSGRWDTGRQRFLLPLSAPFAGGTAAQQERLAASALAVVTDQTQESWPITQAVKQLAWLPAISSDPLMALADDPRPLVRTSALFALARLDTDTGLPTLLAALRDARARIAIHTLRRFLLAMPTPQALAILRDVPLDRVTVAKEVVRLVGELAPNAAYDELLAFERRDLHRDVRIALLRAFGAYLDRDQTWTILEQAARSSEPEIAGAVLTLTPLRYSSLLAFQHDNATLRHALRLAAALLEHPEPQVRLAALRYCSGFAVNDDERIIVPGLLERVHTSIPTARSRSEQDELLAATEALFGVCTPADAAAIAQLLRELLPQRRLLQHAAKALGSTQRVRERGLVPVFRAVLDALANDPLTATLCVELAIPHLAVGELAEFLAALARDDSLHVDALARAVDLLQHQTTRFDDSRLETLELTLSESDDERLRRLALAVLQTRATRLSAWDDELMSRLRAYRADSAALVAAAAQFTFPLGDDPEESGDPESGT